VRVRRCYNCGEFANHIAAKCSMGPQPKRCHHCKSDGHLIADCPTRVKKGSDQEDSAGSEKSDGKESPEVTDEGGKE